MSSTTPPVELSQVRLHCACDKETCSGEVVVVETAHTKEIFVRCAPTMGLLPELNFDEQTRRFYNCLPKLLGQAGADVSHVVLERAFFADFAADMETFQQIRSEFYSSQNVAEDSLPATTYIQQPPCRETQQVELQIYAVLPVSDQFSIQTIYDPESKTTAKLMKTGEVQQLYIAEMKGITDDPENPGTFREQSDRMFAHAARLLDGHGIKFPKVLRTWCYITDIDNTYADFNLSRNEFFAREGVKRLPASTGIEATLWPPGALVGIDLFAVLNPEMIQAEVMHTPTLNEAADYGSAFSRGMKVEFPDRTILFISGTASVDEYGATVHLGDSRRQIERMLLNVKELLSAQGASFEDLTQIATFLKHKEYLELYELILEEWGIRHIPNTFVETGVCRPDLLCEMEAIAILPKKPDGSIVPAGPWPG